MPANGLWSNFAKHEVLYKPSEHTESEAYQHVLPLINSRAVDLLDSDRLVNQLIGLERRTARGGKDSIDHGPGLHDDVANGVAGALVLASIKASGWTKEEPKRRAYMPPLESLGPNGWLAS